MTNLTFYSLAFEVNMDLYFIYFPELQTICVEYFPSPPAQYKTAASIVRPSVKVLCVSAAQKCQMSQALDSLKLKDLIYLFGTLV